MGTAALASVTPPPTPGGERGNMSNGGSSDTVNGQGKSQRSPRLADKESTKAWRRLLRTTGLNDLEHTKLAPNEAEIRVWQVPGLYTMKTKCWIFSRKAGVWRGSAIVDHEFNGRIVRVSLDEPPPNSTKWEDYVKQDLSPQSISESAKIITDVGREGEMTVVEVKFGKVYERQFIANDEFLKAFYRTVKSEFFKNDDSKWREF
jgi:hypothetical protein